MSTEPSAERTVMVIEDDADCLGVVKDILELSSYRVLAVRNGQEALDMLRRGERPGLILLDLMLPVMDGLQFRDAQLKDPSIAGIPVIAFTAGRDGAAAARECGAADFLSKPVGIGELLGKVARHFPASGA